MSTFLRGPRVELQPLESDHLELLKQPRNDPAFRRSFGYRRPWNDDRIEEFYEQSTESDDSVNLVVVHDETPIGEVVCFSMTNTEGTLAYWLDEAARGDGLATEAVALLVDYCVSTRRLHRLHADVFETNDPSQQLLERLGFTHEGTKREAHFWDGEFHDVYGYGLLASEWTADILDG